ncbi:hypothetical protein, partial [Enterococcus faecium]
LLCISHLHKIRLGVIKNLPFRHPLPNFQSPASAGFFFARFQPVSGFGALQVPVQSASGAFTRSHSSITSRKPLRKPA